MGDRQGDTQGEAKLPSIKAPMPPGRENDWNVLLGREAFGMKFISGCPPRGDWVRLPRLGELRTGGKRTDGAWNSPLASCDCLWVLGVVMVVRLEFWMGWN